jgi:spore coat polysaccharide biosynthesis protein SpsF
MTDVVIRCDASERIGFGHLSRSIALAQAFAVDCGMSVSLLMRPHPKAIETARTAGVHVVNMASSDDAEAMAMLPDARALVLDYRGEMNHSLLPECKRRGIVVATIDDPTPRRLQADLAFYPPIPQIGDWLWDGFDGELLTGWEWVVLRRDIGVPRERRGDTKPRIVISMGGSDPADFSAMAVRAATPLLPRCQPLLIIGPANLRSTGLQRLAAASGIEFVVAPSDFTELLRGADLIIASFGVTAYESAALRVPSLFCCLTDDHAQSAGIFETAGLARTVGVLPSITESEIQEATGAAIDAHADNDSWMHRVPLLLDGGGSTRIAQRIRASMI